jgi:hypothetical protein
MFELHVDFDRIGLALCMAEGCQKLEIAGDPVNDRQWAVQGFRPFCPWYCFAVFCGKAHLEGFARLHEQSLAGEQDGVCGHNLVRHPCDSRPLNKRYALGSIASLCRGRWAHVGASVKGFPLARFQRKVSDLHPTSHPAFPSFLDAIDVTDARRGAKPVHRIVDRGNSAKASFSIWRF